MKQNEINKLELGIWLLAGFALRIIEIGSRLLEHDEGFAAVRIFSYIEYPYTFLPPYYALMKIWSWIFGITITSLRFPSMVASVLTILLGWILFKDFLSKTGQRFYLLLSVISPFSIYYAQFFKPYAIISFLCLAALILALEKRTYIRITLALLIALFAFLCHFTSVLYIFGFIISVLMTSKFRIRIKIGMLLVIVFGIYTFFWLIHPLLWSDHYSASFVFFEAPFRFLKLLFNRYVGAWHLYTIMINHLWGHFPLPGSPRIWKSITGVLLLFVGYGIFIFRKTTNAELRNKLDIVILTIVTAHITALYITNGLPLTPYIVPKYLLPSLIPLLGLIAIGLNKLYETMKIPAVLCGLSIVMISAVGLNTTYNLKSPIDYSDFKGIEKTIVKHAEKNEAVISAAELWYPLKYYWILDNNDIPLLCYPAPGRIHFKATKVTDEELEKFRKDILPFEGVWYLSNMMTIVDPDEKLLELLKEENVFLGETTVALPWPGVSARLFHFGPKKVKAEQGTDTLSSD